MASMATRMVVTACPPEAALMAPKGGMGAVGCTIMTPITRSCQRPRERSRRTGAFEVLLDMNSVIVTWWGRAA